MKVAQGYKPIFSLVSAAMIFKDWTVLWRAAYRETMKGYFEDHSIESNHGRRSLRAGAVVLGARVLITVIQLLTFLVLARLLSPEDYGLVGMVTVITAFAPLLVSLGTPDAVVRRARITDEDISALFWISMAVGGSAAITMAACGPLIARFYGEPRLMLIAEISAVGFVVSALYCQHNTLLRRAMKFKELAAVELVANVLSAGAAIVMSLYGLQYWALVMRPLVLTSFIAFGDWALCPWVPGRPTNSRGAKEMLRQGLHTVGFLMTEFIVSSTDRIAIGYRSGPTPLGYYQNAMFIYDNLGALLVISAHNVAVASLSKSQNNRSELRRLWRKALLTLDFYAMPAYGLLAVVGQDLITMLFGNKWSQAGFLISILALRGIPQAVERTMGWLHVSAGRTDRWMRWGFMSMCVQLIALFCGLPYGPTGVAVAFVICSFILFIPAIAYAGRPLGIGAADVIEAIWRPLAASLLAAAVCFTLRFTLLGETSAISRIFVLALVYAAVYVTVVAGFLAERMPIQVIFAMVRDSLPTRIWQYASKRRFFESRK
jgi:PST family polysaccharide transporter